MAVSTVPLKQRAVYVCVCTCAADSQQGQPFGRQRRPTCRWGWQSKLCWPICSCCSSCSCFKSMTQVQQTAHPSFQHTTQAWALLCC